MTNTALNRTVQTDNLFLYLNLCIMKKKILFSYYLQKLAQMEQELLGVNDQRMALLALVLTKANLFRRICSGCTMQTLYFCNPMYIEELFIYLCLKAGREGMKLRSQFHFVQSSASYPGMWGQPYVEDKDITLFLAKVYPMPKSKKEVDIDLYRRFLDNMSSDELWQKFIQLCNFRNVNTNALCTSEHCEETALIDVIFEKLKDDKVLQNMLSLNSRCNIYAQSPAYKEIQKRINLFPM